MRVFQNLEQPLRIRGFRRQDSVLQVFFFGEETRVVKCADSEKATELLQVGIGGIVKLYNVRLSYDSAILTTITANSGIRVLVEAPIPECNPIGPPPIINAKPPTRWNCLVCNWLNYSSTSVCKSCKTTRKQGPVAPASFFRHLTGPPYSRPPWTCPQCFARKNSHWKDECWKCGRQKKKHKNKDFLMYRL
jgi:hypothetical protein